MFDVGGTTLRRLICPVLRGVAAVLVTAINCGVGYATMQPPTVWYRADAGVTLSNNVVTQWDDMTGNGWDLALSQGDPGYITNAVNGMPAVTFNGDDVLTSGYAGETATIFVVGQTTAPDGSAQTYLSGGSWEFYADEYGDTGQAFSIDSLTGMPARSAQTTKAELITNTGYLQAGRFDRTTGSIELFSQGFLKDTNTALYPPPTNTPLVMGASNSGSDFNHYLKGQINEVLIYDRVLSNTEMLEVQSYLTRWFGGDPTENNYMAASWVSDTDQRLYILQSEDAHTFTGAYASHDPIGDDVVRDPSIMYDQTSGYWYVVYTAGHWSVATDYIGLARSRDGVFWDNVARIDTSSVAQNDPRSWAPEWVEDEDGWHVILGLSSNGSATLEMYEVHPTSDDFTQWSLPDKLTGLQSNVVDGMVTVIDGVYHLWYTDRTTRPWSNVLATADSLTGPYTLDPSLQGNWYPVEASVEGPYVVQIDGDHWRMFFDQPGPGTKLIPGVWTGLYIDSYDGMQTWSLPSHMVSPATRHLSILNMNLLDLTLTGDLNGDGFVGLDDLDIILVNWNEAVTAGDLLSGDPSSDGYVGLEDLDIVLGNWNAGTPPIQNPADIPEPASVLFMLLGLWGLIRRRRDQRLPYCFS